jgi:hypothetical protein
VIDLPQSISCSEVDILGVKVKVHQLDNGQRIIEADSMAALFEAMSGGGLSPESLENLVRALRS